MWVSTDSGVRHATESGDTYASSNQCEKKQMLGILTGHYIYLATACEKEKDRLQGWGLRVHVPADGWSLAPCKGGVCDLNLTP